MAWFILVRLLFAVGVTYTAAVVHPLPGGVVANTAFGATLAAVAVALEWRMKDVSVPHLLGALLGGALGLLFADLVNGALLANDDPAWLFLHRMIDLAFPYVGIVIGARRGEWLEPSRLITLFRAAGPQRRYKLLDTSVIIDGRVAYICENGFLDGTLVVPQFVLKELQQIADSSDTLKRNRGRRGLDILQKIQKMAGVEVMISDLDFPEIREVDLKLIELGRTLQGKIVTNDFNLNKVAQLRGVKILNINDLANCLRPLVLPGEPMRIFVSKEGKEHGQGVGYLDDGTMVVVEGGRMALGRTIDVNVTTVLQTAAGKMIFVRWPEAPADDLTRSKDTRPPMRRTDGKTNGNGNGNGDAHAASLRDTDEVPLASRQTAEQLPAIANGTTNREQ